MNKLANWTVSQYNEERERIRSTSLKWMLTGHGPREYYLRVTGQLETDRKAGDHFDLGNLLHELCLEGRRGWFVCDERRGSKAHAAAVAENPGLIDIKSHDEALLISLYDAVMGNHEARALIENSMTEQTFLWTDSETGLKCKSRADILCPDGSIADIKTWTSKNGQCSPERFFWHVDDMGYHHSAAFYEMGRDACLGSFDAPFFHIAVFKKPPYWTYVWPLSQYAVEVGRRDVQRAMRQIVECTARQSELESLGLDPIEAWPDLMEDTQSAGYTPSDSWLARNEYGYQ